MHFLQWNNSWCISNSLAQAPTFRCRWPTQIQLDVFLCIFYFYCEFCRGRYGRNWEERKLIIKIDYMKFSKNIKKNYTWIIPLGIYIFIVVIDTISHSLDCLQIHDPPAPAFQCRHIRNFEMLGISLQLFLVIYEDYLDLTGVLHCELVYLFLSLQWELPNGYSLESASNTCSNCLDCFLLQHCNYLKTRKTFQSAEERQLIWRKAGLGLNHDVLLAVQLECIVYHQGEINDYSKKKSPHTMN